MAQPIRYRHKILEAMRYGQITAVELADDMNSLADAAPTPPQ